MPFGCFGGKRKKKDKTHGEAGGNESSPLDGRAPAAASGNQAKADGDGVSESVIALRTQSLNASAPGNIQKSATLARYDFLRKSDYVNSADRWAALKEQYLVPKMTQSQYGDHLVPQQPTANGPTPRGSGRVAQSLPRQFSPPSTVVSVVKFSHWFYERQVKEEEARREALDREEKTRRLMEGRTDEEEMEEAASKIQASFQAYKTRKLLHEHMQLQQQEDQPEASPRQDGSAHELEDAAARIQAGFRGYQTRKQLAEAKHQSDQEPHQEAGQAESRHHQQLSDHANESLDDLDENDPRLNAAATKIQAGFKGMQARKEVREIRKHKEEDEGHHAEDGSDHQIDNVKPSTEEMNEAAAKIQAGFKGFKTRKQMGKLHDNQSEHLDQQQDEHGESAAS